MPWGRAFAVAIAAILGGREANVAAFCQPMKHARPFSRQESAPQRFPPPASSAARAAHDTLPTAAIHSQTVRAEAHSARRPRSVPTANATIISRSRSARRWAGGQMGCAPSDPADMPPVQWWKPLPDDRPAHGRHKAASFHQHVSLVPAGISTAWSVGAQFSGANSGLFDGLALVPLGRWRGPRWRVAGPVATADGLRHEVAQPAAVREQETRGQDCTENDASSTTLSASGVGWLGTPSSADRQLRRVQTALWSLWAGPDVQ